jgi:hypothetical protein
MRLVRISNLPKNRRISPMSRTLLFASALVLIALAADQSRAGSVVYDFSVSAEGLSSSGTLTTSDTVNGYGTYTIESITGTYSGPDTSGAITGLSDFNGPSNELYVTSPGVPGPGPYLDSNGFSFYVGFDGIQENIALLSPPSSYFMFSSASYFNFGDFTLTSAVPEPSSLILGGIAVVSGMVVAIRRCRK